MWVLMAVIFMAVLQIQWFPLPIVVMWTLLVIFFQWIPSIPPTLEAFLSLEVRSNPFLSILYFIWPTKIAAILLNNTHNVFIDGCVFDHNTNDLANGVSYLFSPPFLLFLCILLSSPFAFPFRQLLLFPQIISLLPIASSQRTGEMFMIF